MRSPVLLLDGSVSPYLPTEEILDAIEHASAPALGVTELAGLLRTRLAHLHDVSADRIALYPNDAARFGRLLESRTDRPLVLYPPSELDRTELARLAPIVNIERSGRFRIDTAQIQATPPGATVLVMTPNDPTGNAISLTTAAQLARRSGLLVLDERSAEMQRRSMIPLVEEFDSIVLMRSFADWAGLAADTPGYAIATNRIAASMDRSAELTIPGLHAALAAVSNAAKLDAVAHRVQLERMRLYRMLRKLNFLLPFPSDAGYVLAALTRGDRDAVAAALAERGIAVFSSAQPRLQQTLRFSAISPAATRQLQDALTDIARTELG